jgi:hypothetical protein
MKKNILILLIAVILPIILLSMFLHPDAKSENKIAKTPTYIIIAWNDLGMHCANKYFGNFSVLPPYNNHHAQVILLGNASILPQILTTGYHVTYEIPGNTYSIGKTDFWTYVDHLFGVSLPNNIGLTGVGLTGIMSKTGNYFHVEGIPITPYPDNDLVNEHPYQLTLIKVFDTANNLLASTQSVIPVSNEFNCISSGCHTSETQILNLHETVAGFDPANTPILCAGCHKDNALGMNGTAGVPAFSQAIHEQHGDKTNDCYKCHPGPNTQCFRDIMKQGGMVCQDCHGTVANVGNTISNGREAWLQEPDCGTSYCHGPNHASEPAKLFRNSKGHGNLYCSACHGSPHAILPTTQANDNVQNIALQGYAGTLNKCVVCHTVNPTGPGPHGLYATDVEYIPGVPSETCLNDIFPNPVSTTATISFTLKAEAKVTVELFNYSGQRIRLFIDRYFKAGSYDVSLDSEEIPAGIYFYKLTAGDKAFSKKLLVLK